jgi:hypothetical protein
VIINSIPDLSLQFDKPLSLLRVEWTSGDDMRGFRSAAEQLIKVAKELQVRHMLLNMNTFPDISVYDQVWLGTNFMPGLVKLPLERVVLAIHRRMHNQLAVDALIALSRPFIRFDIQFFPQPAPGLHWLSDYSTRMPALLAEWEALHGAVLPVSDSTEFRPQYRPYGS